MTLNTAALTYWKHSGYTNADVDAACKEKEDVYLFGKVEFADNQELKVTLSKRIASTGYGHYASWVRYFQDLQYLPGEPLRGTFLLWAEDGMWDWLNHRSRKAPVIAFGRHKADHCTLLMPDPAFINSNGYVKEIQSGTEIDTRYPWAAKIPTVFWRGASSGLGMNSKDDLWKRAPRIQLALASKKINNPEFIDAMISTVVDYGEPIQSQRVRDLGIVGEYRPFEDFLRYRYQVDVEGICCAWISCFLKLASKSLVLKVESDYLQWYYDRIIPWEHYVPIAGDSSDIVEKIQWIHRHDEQCREIALRASALMPTITYRDSLLETKSMLQTLFACQRF